MPRLVGKQSHTGENVAALLVLAAVVGVALEYAGVINVIPGFGRDGRHNVFQNRASSEHVMTQTSHQ